MTGNVTALMDKDPATSSAILARNDVQVFVAPQWKLMWWKFRKHRVAMFCTVLTILLYSIALFVEVIAPFRPEQYWARYTYAPPQPVHLLDEGRFRPFVYDYDVTVDMESLRRRFQISDRKIPLALFVQGPEYKLWGVIPMDVHMIGTPMDQPFYLLGADRIGRDQFSRLVYGSRISLSIGLIGVVLSLVAGVVLGGLSGYYSGTVDLVIQRVIEFLRSIPTIPLWMGLAAALPRDWGPLQVYLGITIILSLVSWTWMARVVRGRFLSLREEDFVLAARLNGASQFRIVLRHMVPSFLSHIIASVTLSIPGMILSETSLSFLGLGLRPPTVSWGVLLQEAQNIPTVAQSPWLLLPGLAVSIAVLAMNFMGDGLRDAADPYGG